MFSIILEKLLFLYKNLNGNLKFKFFTILVSFMQESIFSRSSKLLVYMYFINIGPNCHNEFVE
jgi:hypothetical protein